MAGLGLSRVERRRAAALLRESKTRIATAANDAFLQRHPDWRVRYGALAERRGMEDAAFHVEFLAGALDAGEVEAFVDYVHWLLEVLRARGIGGDAVAQSLALVGAEGEATVRAALNQSVGDAIASIVRAGVAVASARGAPMQAMPGTTGKRVEPEHHASHALARAAFLRAILQGERQGALGIASEALRTMERPADVYVEVIQWALEEVGRRWQRREITVAQEHMATAVVQFVLAQLYSLVERPPATRGVAVITGVQGELHQVGATLVADSLELDGWKVRFLGTNMPHEGIIDVVAESKADLVGISATMLFHVDAVARLVDAVRADPRHARAPRILVGGSAFRSAPELWREIGADAFGIDAREACAAARAYQIDIPLGGT